MTGGARVREVFWLALLAVSCGGTKAAVTSAHEPNGNDTSDSSGARAEGTRAAEVERLLSEAEGLARQHRPSEEEAPLRRAIAQAWGFGRPWAQYRARGWSLLSRAHLAEGRAADAREAAERALGLLSPGALADDQQISELETTRGEALRGEQQLAAAVAAFSGAVQATERHPQQLAPALVAISLRLAETLEALGRRQDAKLVLEKASRVAAQPAVGARLSGRLRDALAAFADPRASERAPQLAAASANTTQQVAAMQAEFRACYQKTQAEERDVAGRVALVLTIAADGHVSSVKTDGAGLPGTTVDCLVRSAYLAHFEPPKGGSATITVPVTFVQQND